MILVPETTRTSSLKNRKINTATVPPRLAASDPFRDFGSHFDISSLNPSLPRKMSDRDELELQVDCEEYEAFTSSVPESEAEPASSPSTSEISTTSARSDSSSLQPDDDQVMLLILEPS